MKNREAETDKYYILRLELEEEIKMLENQDRKKILQIRALHDEIVGIKEQVNVCMILSFILYPLATVIAIVLSLSKI